jgi:hypothetical protein
MKPDHELLGTLDLQNWEIGPMSFSKLLPPAYLRHGSAVSVRGYPPVKWSWWSCWSRDHVDHVDHLCRVWRGQAIGGILGKCRKERAFLCAFDGAVQST